MRRNKETNKQPNTKKQTTNDKKHVTEKITLKHVNPKDSQTSFDAKRSEPVAVNERVSEA